MHSFSSRLKCGKSVIVYVGPSENFANIQAKRLKKKLRARARETRIVSNIEIHIAHSISKGINNGCEMNWSKKIATHTIFNTMLKQKSRRRWKNIDTRDDSHDDDTSWIELFIFEKNQTEIMSRFAIKVATSHVGVSTDFLGNLETVMQK